MTYKDMMRAEMLQAYTLVLWFLWSWFGLSFSWYASRPGLKSAFWFVCLGVLSCLIYARYF